MLASAPPLRRLALAAAFYLAWFVALTWPAARALRSGLLADAGDGLQNVWNLWWVRKALVELHQSPLHTRYLHFPEGTTLVGHTLNPFNGLVAVLLHPVCSLLTTYNVILVASFVLTGVTAFLLCRHVSGSTWGSLWGGFVFTFSSFHFAHAQGHLQLVSLEWMPLFLLAWLRWLERPTAGRALGAGAAIVLVLLCDLYLTFFCVVAAAALAAWWIGRSPAPLAKTNRYLRSAPLLLLVGGAPVAAWVAALLATNRVDPLVGAHDPAQISMDLLAPFVYGGHWRLAAWTRGYWARLPGNVHESSLHLGWAVLVAVGWAAARRRRIPRPGVGVWLGLGVGFALLALGPVLHVAGRAVPAVPMPYRALAALLPPLRLSGSPARFFVVTDLACAVLVALAFPLLRAGPLARPVAALAALALLAVERWPAPLPLTRPAVPGYVTALAVADGDGAVLDLVSPPAWMLYYQTIHEKPMAFGYISRYPLSAITRGMRVLLDGRALLQQDPPSRESAERLRAAGFRWAVARQRSAPIDFLRVRWADERVVLYELAAP